MKIGDRIKVIEVDEYFDKGSELEVGDEGVINCFDEEEINDVDDDCYMVMFDKEIKSTEHCKVNSDGTYPMFRCQFEVIEEAP